MGFYRTGHRGTKITGLGSYNLASLRCAMNKISKISYFNSSPHAYCFMFNLIGEYSMNDNFLVDYISITCDRINELKLVLCSPICYVS
jgi:hypothetical protein